MRIEQWHVEWELHSTLKNSAVPNAPSHRRNAKIHFHCFPPHAVAAAAMVAPLFELHVIYSLIRATFFPFTFDDSFVSRRINIIHSRELGARTRWRWCVKWRTLLPKVRSVFSHFWRFPVLSLDMNCVAGDADECTHWLLLSHTTQLNDVRVSRHICKWLVLKWISK